MANPQLDAFLATNLQPPPAPDPAPAVAETPVPAEPAAIETAAAPAAVEGEKGTTPVPELPPRGEDGKFVKREDAKPPGHMVPLEALLAEREKRQAAERAAEERAKSQPKPDFWENPEAVLKARDEELRRELMTEADRRAEQKAREQFFTYTEQAARGRHADYDQVREVFGEEAQKNPALTTQLRDAADPAEFIYRQGKIAQELREVGGDLAAYRARIEAQARQKFEKEFAERQAKVATPPQSLNTEPSKGAGITGAAWAGPTPIEDIFPRR